MAAYDSFASSGPRSTSLHIGTLVMSGSPVSQSKDYHQQEDDREQQGDLAGSRLGVDERIADLCLTVASPSSDGSCGQQSSVEGSSPDISPADGRSLATW